MDAYEEQVVILIDDLHDFLHDGLAFAILTHRHLDKSAELSDAMIHMNDVVADVKLLKFL